MYYALIWIYYFINLGSVLIWKGTNSNLPTSTKIFINILSRDEAKINSFDPACGIGD